MVINCWAIWLTLKTTNLELVLINHSINVHTNEFFIRIMTWPSLKGNSVPRFMSRNNFWFTTWKWRRNQLKAAAVYKKTKRCEVKSSSDEMWIFRHKIKWKWKHNKNLCSDLRQCFVHDVFSIYCYFQFSSFLWHTLFEVRSMSQYYEDLKTHFKAFNEISFCWNDLGKAFTTDT